MDSLAESIRDFFFFFWIFGFLLAKKVREITLETKYGFSFIFLHFLGDQREGSGFSLECFITWECYCCRFWIVVFLFEQLWNYCRFGLELRMKFLLDWWSLLFGIFWYEKTFGLESLGAKFSPLRILEYRKVPLCSLIIWLMVGSKIWEIT